MKNKYKNIAFVLIVALIGFLPGCFEGTAFDITKDSNKKICGDLGSWTATTSLNADRSQCAGVAYNGYIYVIGGQALGQSNEVVYAPINANGAVGAWTVSSNNLNTARRYPTSVAYNGYLYVIGGENTGTDLASVEYAPINSNGTIGTWTTNGNSLNAVRQGAGSVVHNGYIYVTGGSFRDTVEYAPINANGTIGLWITSPNIFNIGRRYHTSVVHNGYLYVIGGISGSHQDDVQYVSINSNGSIGTWSSTTSITTAMEGHASVVYNGFLYVIGGKSVSGSDLNSVEYVSIKSNGALGTWTSTTSFTTGRKAHVSVVYNGYLYVIGGEYGLAPTRTSSVQFAKQCP